MKAGNVVVVLCAYNARLAVIGAAHLYAVAFSWSK